MKEWIPVFTEMKDKAAADLKSAPMLRVPLQKEALIVKATSARIDMAARNESYEDGSTWALFLEQSSSSVMALVAMGILIT